MSLLRFQCAKIEPFSEKTNNQARKISLDAQIPSVGGR